MDDPCGFAARPAQIPIASMPRPRRAKYVQRTESYTRPRDSAQDRAYEQRQGDQRMDQRGPPLAQEARRFPWRDTRRESQDRRWVVSDLLGKRRGDEERPSESPPAGGNDHERRRQQDRGRGRVRSRGAGAVPASQSGRVRPTDDRRG